MGRLSEETGFSMSPRMTIRRRIEAALRHEPVDRIPFTIYPGMIRPKPRTRDACASWAWA